MSGPNCRKQRHKSVQDSTAQQALHRNIQQDPLTLLDIPLTSSAGSASFQSVRRIRKCHLHMIATLGSLPRKNSTLPQVSAVCWRYVCRQSPRNMPLKRHQTDGAVHPQGQPPYGYGYPQQPGYGPPPYPYAPGPSPGYYPPPQAGYGEQSCGTLSFRRFCLQHNQRHNSA